jgi:hypothetical protein
MAKKEHISETQATQLLRKHQVSFEEHPYPYEEHGGTSVSARELGVPEHAIRIRYVGMDIHFSLACKRSLRDSTMSIPNDAEILRIKDYCPYPVLEQLTDNFRFIRESK